MGLLVLDYKKIYDALVEKCKVRGLDKSKHEGYFENHHIIPKSVGGSDEQSNMVMFTGREHFIAHMLLHKIYPEDISLMRAAFLMSSRWSTGQFEESKPIHSKTYEKLRQEYSESVRVQMTKNNPWKGKAHSSETLARIKETKKANAPKKRLREWKQNNEKYMSYFKFKTSQTLPFEITVEDSVGLLHGKYDYNLWLKAEHIKSFWERSGKPDKKFLSNQIFEVCGVRFPQHRMKVLLQRLNEGWEPSSDPSFVVTALISYSEEFDKDMSDFINGTSKTISEIKNEYFSSWLENRELYRSVINDYIVTNGTEKHKNNSMAKLSLVDVVEACILWKSNLVEQKQISNLLGVARNSISNALEAEGRWLSAREAANELMETYFVNKNHCAMQ